MHSKTKEEKEIREDAWKKRTEAGEKKKMKRLSRENT